jgi:ketosteroid isomerase-like protein
MKILSIALLLALAIPALVSAQTAEEALKKLENDWANALVKKDFATLNKILADDFTYTDAEGVLWAKTAGLNAI